MTPPSDSLLQYLLKRNVFAAVPNLARPLNLRIHATEL